VDCYRRDVQREVAEAGHEDRFLVLADAPRSALAGFVDLPGDRSLVVSR